MPYRVGEVLSIRSTGRADSWLLLGKRSRGAPVTLFVRPRMRAVIPASIALGIAWNVVAVSLMGGRIVDAFAPSWLLAGALAGVAAGTFTIWSRRRQDDRESLLYGIANYYVGIFVYWASFVVIQRTIMCVQHGGWTDFDLRDHLVLILTFLIYGTIWFGIILIPFCFLCRYVLWKIYIRTAA
jgi:hypothetical protein